MLMLLTFNVITDMLGCKSVILLFFPVSPYLSSSGLFGHSSIFHSDIFEYISLFNIFNGNARDCNIHMTFITVY